MECAQRICDLASVILTNIDNGTQFDELRRLRRDLPLFVKKTAAALRGGDQMQRAELQTTLDRVLGKPSALDSFLAHHMNKRMDLRIQPLDPGEQMLYILQRRHTAVIPV